MGVVRGLVPSCRCEPGDRHPLCDLHGETGRAICSCWHPDSGHPEPATPDPHCPVHGRDADPYGPPAPERTDPYLTHYDPFTHGPLDRPRHWSPR